MNNLGFATCYDRMNDILWNYNSSLQVIGAWYSPESVHDTPNNDIDPTIHRKVKSIPFSQLDSMTSLNHPLLNLRELKVEQLLSPLQVIALVLRTIEGFILYRKRMEKTLFFVPEDNNYQGSSVLNTLQLLVEIAQSLRKIISSTSESSEQQHEEKEKKETEKKQESEERGEIIPPVSDKQDVQPFQGEEQQSTSNIEIPPVTPPSTATTPTTTTNPDEKTNSTVDPGEREWALYLLGTCMRIIYAYIKNLSKFTPQEQHPFIGPEKGTLLNLYPFSS